MSFITTKDGVEIFFKDWGPKNAQPLVFHHGWPLSSDDWDAQMLFFLARGFRGRHALGKTRARPVERAGDAVRHERRDVPAGIQVARRGCRHALGQRA